MEKDKKEILNKLRKISQPIIDFIKENYNPHTTVIISEDSIKVVADEIHIPNNNTKIKRM